MSKKTKAKMLIEQFRDAAAENGDASEQTPESEEGEGAEFEVVTSGMILDDTVADLHEMILQLFESHEELQDMVVHLYSIVQRIDDQVNPDSEKDSEEKVQ